MNFISRRPSVPKQIREDVTEFINRLHDEYQAWDWSYQDELRDFIERCGFLTVALEDDNVFVELARHPYWEKSRQKPKQNGRGKWAVYAMCRPYTEESRKVVGKYGRVIDILLKQGVQPKDFAEVMKERHGINLIIKGRNQKALGGPAGTKAIARQAEKETRRVSDLDQEDQDQDQKDQDNQDQEQEDQDEYVVPPKPVSFNKLETKNLFVQATKYQMRQASHSGKILIYANVSWDGDKEKWLIVADDIVRDDD